MGGFVAGALAWRLAGGAVLSAVSSLWAARAAPKVAAETPEEEIERLKAELAGLEAEVAELQAQRGL